MNFRRCLMTAALLSAGAGLHALEIPLQRGDGKVRKNLVLGFVDMDRIYQEFPETRKARQEYQEQADKIKKTLTDKASELDDLREQLSVLKAAAQVPVAVSTVAASTGPATAPGLGSNLAEKERVLADEEADLTLARKEAAAALAEFEKRRAAQIFGKLYTSLVQLADEKGVDLVMEKSALLYGQQGLDLTEALSRRVRGLPAEEEEEP